MRGQSGPHTTELSLSCSFVEHTGGEDTDTLLIKILQMQTSFLTRDGSGNLVTTFSTGQSYSFSIFSFSLYLVKSFIMAVISEGSSLAGMTHSPFLFVVLYQEYDQPKLTL